MTGVDERPLYCPNCGARYSADAGLLDQGLLVLCGLCGQVSNARDALEPTVASPADPEAVAEASWPQVVVGHEQPAALRTLATVLRGGGYAPLCVRSGDLVLQACDPSLPSRPAAVVMDVAVPGILAFEVLEQLRAVPATASIPVVLLASVFERTRYKRRPNRLYGADAYLELHHVPDRLVEVLDSVREGLPPGRDRGQAPSDRAAAAPLRARIDPVGEDAQRAYARRLLSDVALYHGEEIACGVRQGAPLAELEEAIEEARQRFLTDTGEQTSGAAVFEDELEAFKLRLSERRKKRADG